MNDKLLRAIPHGDAPESAPRFAKAREHVHTRRIQTDRARQAIRPADQELVRRISTNDPFAFSDLYEMYRNNVHGFILSRINDPTEAEDLTQETFTQAYRSIGTFEGRSTLLTWLLGIARFTCLRFFRYSSRWMTGWGATSSDYEPMLDDRVEPRLDARRSLARCGEIVEAVYGDDAATIFRLRFGEGLSIRAIASRVEKSGDAVKTSLRRSRLAIRENLPGCDEVAGESHWMQGSLGRSGFALKAG
jgi:RNA polymerase sigma-70 factor, ECF subfamily